MNKDKNKEYIIRGIVWAGLMVVGFISISVVASLIVDMTEPDNIPDWIVLLLLIYWVIVSILVWYPILIELWRSTFNKEIKTKEEAIKIKTLELNFLESKINNSKSIFEKELSIEDGINKYKKELQLLNQKKEELSSSISKMETQNNELKNEIKLLSLKENELALERSTDYLNYIHPDDDLLPAELKNQLSVLSTQEKTYIRNMNEQMSNFKTEFTSTDREQFKIMMRLFESESEGHLKSLTVNNVDTLRNRIIKSYETINNLFRYAQIRIGERTLEFKLSKLAFLVEYEKQLQNEKEEQRIIRAQIQEETKAKKELEDKEKVIEKEIRQFSSESKKLMSYLSKSNTDVERELYSEKIKELESKIKQLMVDKKDIENRILNTRAGYVYIISNIGSFGENIYKIGLTRRLEPMDRIKELGSASVPFEFDVHAMIFSEDAPLLELTLHEHFRDRQVNKVNPRKEFFNVKLEEIEDVVLENHNATVTFTMKARAEQYYQSLAISNE